MKEEDRKTAKSLTRREVLRLGGGVVGTAGLAAVTGGLTFRDKAIQERSAPTGGYLSDHARHDSNSTAGELTTDWLDPEAYLHGFEAGRVSRLPSGQTLREYQMAVVEREIEVAPGVFFPAWTYNGQVPGPTIRCTEGDRVRVHFANTSGHAHTMHFHGAHPANMDGAFEIVEPGGTFTYEFDAEPFGLHLYHCHVPPFKKHIHKGLYGAFIVDPPQGRAPAREMVMVLNGFDTNFDNENEVYAVNSVAFHYQHHPISLTLGELARVYLVNMTEFDLINSFHLHGNLFRCFRTGTDLDRFESTDTVMLCQGERAVLEFEYKHAGRFMFHAHQSEFAELGWTGIFDVRDPAASEGGPA
jgi:FtsP/CotA-like multicopper oxidase with cupredoxin domain